MKIAIASSDGKVINQHFGKCSRFSIYEIATETKDVRFLETRNVDSACNGNGHSPEGLNNVAEQLVDCQFVVASRIGNGAVTLIKEHNIQPIEFGGLITEFFERVQQTSTPEGA